MRGQQVFMESLIAHGVSTSSATRNHREPHPRRAAGLPAAQVHRDAARGRGAGRGQLLRPGDRKAGGGQRARGARARQCARHALQRLQGPRAAGRDRGAAGHAPPPARAGARPRSGGDGRAAHQVERPGGARRRVRADHAPRAEDRHRPAGRAGVRGPAHRRARAGDRGRAVPARAALPRGRARSGRHQAAAVLLLASRRPVIVAGDDAASAATEVSALAEQLGAAVWCEGIRAHQVLPSAHPNFRLGLPFDAVAIRKALDGADVVLLVGGPFFEEVWYAPGSPLPPGAAPSRWSRRPSAWRTNCR